MAKTPPKPVAKAPAKSVKSAKPAAKSAPTPAPKPVLTKHNPRAVPEPAAKPAPLAKAAPASPPPVPTIAASAPILRTTGLSPKQQRLLALQQKLAHKTSGAKPLPGASAQSFNAKSFTGKKTPFQRKAV